MNKKIKKSKESVEIKEEKFVTIRLTKDDWDSLKDKIDNHIDRWNNGDSNNIFEILISQDRDKIEYRVSVESTMIDVEEGEI